MPCRAAAVRVAHALRELRERERVADPLVPAEVESSCAVALAARGHVLSTHATYADAGAPSRELARSNAG